MKTAIHIPRALAKAQCSKENNNYFWISIGEPEMPETRLDSDFHIDFWDITQRVNIVGQGALLPMEESKAKELIEVITQNQHRPLIVNCQAGISRSAAVCAFVSKYLGYYWANSAQYLHTYNRHVYNMLETAYLNHE